MEQHSESAKLDKQVVLEGLVGILETMTSDWDLDLSGQIGPDTALVADLDFSSIDVVMMVVSIEEHFGQARLPWEKLLMTDGRYVDDLRVLEVADFLSKQLQA